DDFGNLSRLSSNNISINSDETFLATTSLSTIDSGYAIFQAYITRENYNTNRTFSRAELNVTFISFNQTIPDYRNFILYQDYQPRLNISNLGVYCVTVSFGVGHICTVFVNSSTISYYVKINFLSSGAVLSSTIIPPPPKIPSLPQQNFRMMQMPYGGYIFDSNSYSLSNNTSYHYIYAYDEDNDLIDSFSIYTNEFDVDAIMNNNTLLFASPYTNSQNTSWSLLTIPMPQVLMERDHGYENLLVDKIIPPINAIVNSSTDALKITFYEPIVLSTGNITIYKMSDNNIRQTVSGTVEAFCTIDSDEKTVIIKVISSTFNEYGQLYSVIMDNNFVKSKDYNEPLKGIVGGILKYYSTYRTQPSESDICSARLTTEATIKFLNLSKYEQYKYFDSLLDEISIKLPVNRERLNIFGNPRSIYNPITTLENIEFYILIVNLPNPSQNDKNIPGVISDLDTMITYKMVTDFSFGLTNDLDSSFGFKSSGELIISFKDVIRLSKQIFKQISK
ncbi:13910_t:CDS:2, partial [Dentiscutata heterogama]